MWGLLPSKPNTRANYLSRTIIWLLGAALNASIVDAKLAHVRSAVIIFCLVWPLCAAWAVSSLPNYRRVEATIVLVESFVVAVGAANWSFRLLPTTTFSIACIMDLIIFGGSRLLVTGVLAWIAGALVVCAFGGFAFHPETELLPSFLSILAIFIYVTFFAYATNRVKESYRASKGALKLEEERSRNLLRNILPEAIIERLKDADETIADQFADVTVLFADVVDFSSISERLGPRRTVKLLNDLFLRFDEVADRLGVEKVKTIGDGYLAVAGAPQMRDDHPEVVANMALALLAAAATVSTPDGEPVQIRIGVNTGPIVGGVIGKSRFHYDIWGETVNLASRFESISAPGRILVGETTYRRLQKQYVFEPREPVAVKGHEGSKRTWWLVGPRKA